MRFAPKSALRLRRGDLQFAAFMSQPKLPRQQSQTSPAILREVETNRLVRVMDAKDNVLYRALIRQQPKPGRVSGIVAGEPWRESGYVYIARFSCRVASQSRVIRVSIWLPNGSFWPITFVFACARMSAKHKNLVGPQVRKLRYQRG